MQQAVAGHELENKEFQQTVADQKATAALLTKALNVLKGFYDKKSKGVALAQAGQPAGPPPPPGFKEYKKSGAADPLAVSFDGHTQIVIDLMDALREGRDPHISLDSARHAVEIINSIYESSRTGKEIILGGGS